MDEIARDLIRGFIRETMRFLDPDKHMVIDTKIMNDPLADIRRVTAPILQKKVELF